jgi:hypothetical protein
LWARGVKQRLQEARLGTLEGINLQIESEAFSLQKGEKRNRRSDGPPRYLQGCIQGMESGPQEWSLAEMVEFVNRLPGLKGTRDVYVAKFWELSLGDYSGDLNVSKEIAATLRPLGYKRLSAEKSLALWKYDGSCGRFKPISEVGGLGRGLSPDRTLEFFLDDCAYAGPLCLLDCLYVLVLLHVGATIDRCRLCLEVVESAIAGVRKKVVREATFGRFTSKAFHELLSRLADLRLYSTLAARGLVTDSSFRCGVIVPSQPEFSRLPVDQCGDLWGACSEPRK